MAGKVMTAASASTLDIHMKSKRSKAQGRIVSPILYTREEVLKLEARIFKLEERIAKLERETTRYGEPMKVGGAVNGW